MEIKNKEQIKLFKDELSVPLKDLIELTQGIGHKELEATIKQIHERIEDPFLFVIVGEVKAGKSSFINALLRTKEEICKVAPSPMTDTIQQIVYGPEHGEESLTPYIKRITFPEEILKDIAIVDTPGTNTIVAHHQEITESFIPHSDLIVFVFESKNPYRQSAWDFFDFIHEDWRKKIIFVLQQKDLMIPSELDINIEGVRKYATEKGIDAAKIFAVSAHQELANNPESGFLNLRNYIDTTITGGQAPYLKLQSNAMTAQNINDKITKSIDLRAEQLEIDLSFRNDVKETLSLQESKTRKQIDFLVENLVASYDRITQKKEKELNEGLSIIPMLKRSFSSFMGAKEGPKEWLEALTKDFEQQLNITLKERLQEGVVDIADNIQTMAKLVDAKIKTSETILKNSDEIFADIAEKRSNVLKELQQSFSSFMNSSENFYDHAILDGTEKMAPNLAAGGGIAVVGIILTAVLQGAVFDITGGILTTVGILFAGASVGFKKRSIIKSYRVEIAKGRSKIEEEVSEKLKTYTKRIKERIDSNFSHFDDLLGEEQENITKLNSKKAGITEQLNVVLKKLNSRLN